VRSVPISGRSTLEFLKTAATFAGHIGAVPGWRQIVSSLRPEALFGDGRGQPNPT
jgi:hypothetical protein